MCLGGGWWGAGTPGGAGQFGAPSPPLPPLRNARNHENGSLSAPMARQKLSMSEIPIARRAEAIGRGPGPWKEAPDPKIGVGSMAKPFET